MRSSSEHETSPDSPARRIPRSEPSNWGGPWVALVALLVLATALRAFGLRHGLSFDDRLDPNERDVVSHAWRILNGGGADPDWFRYPSLLLYVLAPLEYWPTAPAFLPARIVIVVAAAATVAVTWWLARRLYGSALCGAVAAAAVAVATTHVAYSHAALPDVPLALGVAVALTFAATGRTDVAAIAAGLAAGFDYTGLLLVVPLIVAAWGRWWRLARGVALMVVAFVATTPYLLVHLGDAWSQATGARGDDLPFGGHVAPADRLWHAFGPVVLVAAAAVVAAAVMRRRDELVLVSFVLAFFVALLASGAHAPRTILPLVPPLAVLVSRFRSLAPVTLLLLVVPLTWSVRDDRKLSAPLPAQQRPRETRRPAVAFRQLDALVHEHVDTRAL